MSSIAKGVRGFDEFLMAAGHKKKKLSSVALLSYL